MAWQIQYCGSIAWRICLFAIIFLLIIYVINEAERRQVSNFNVLLQLEGTHRPSETAKKVHQRSRNN
ncbi:hypothetical protein DVR12_18300 [Chitinophaga silvatica]|uniref:Uncharacterized protein n=1 Tax=Chitinophaga silvatica TaxID=2282649 RepID=A0A3E1Y6G4_9BACT|nr:hypothetical protein DVR12_18300 [Chitinophaga silvatica]